MTEHPVIFSAEEARAALSGDKTQFRRVIRPQPEFSENGYNSVWIWNGHEVHAPSGERSPLGLTPGMRLDCPYGASGDRLVCKEGYRFRYDAVSEDYEVEYRADSGTKILPSMFDDDDDNDARAARFVNAKWSPMARIPNMSVTQWYGSTQMPKWAARFWLTVKEVRAERLQEISLDDCEAEGIKFPPSARSVANFARVWDARFPKHPWKHPRTKGPWVWAVTFEVER